MSRGEFHAGGREQIHKRIGAWRNSLMNGVQNLFILMGSRHGEHFGMGTGNIFRLCPKASGHNHASVGFDRFADGLKAFGFGRVQKPAGVHDHCICACVIRRNSIAFSAQPCKDAFAVDQGLGASQRHHTNGWLTGSFCFSDTRRCKIRAQLRRIRSHRRDIAEHCGSRKGGIEPL